MDLQRLSDHLGAQSRLHVLVEGDLLVHHLEAALVPGLEVGDLGILVGQSLLLLHLVLDEIDLMRLVLAVDFRLKPDDFILFPGNGLLHLELLLELGGLRFAFLGLQRELQGCDFSFLRIKRSFHLRLLLGQCQLTLRRLAHLQFL